MPALIDTGAGRTVVTGEAITRARLSKINETKLVHAGGVIEKADVYVASIHFPRYHLETIEVIQVVHCELPGQPIQCLLGRDVLARWLFTYNGPAFEWKIDEEGVAPWVNPPEGIDE
jgi:predicted aspartyl protease